MPYDDELGYEQHAIDGQDLRWLDGEERNGAKADQKQCRQSGVVAQQQEFTMDLLHARIVVHLLVQAVPRGVFRLGAAQRDFVGHLGEPDLVDPRILLRVLAECAMAWQRVIPSQEDQSCLHVGAEQAVSDGGDNGSEADGQKLGGAVDEGAMAARPRWSSRAAMENRHDGLWSSPAWR